MKTNTIWNALPVDGRTSLRLRGWRMCIALCFVCWMALITTQPARAAEFAPGDELLAIPRHVCPTSALHKEVILIENGKPAATWLVTARDRKLTV